MNGCTIVARNYLGQAAILAESFLEHHPDGTFTTLVLDKEFGLPDGLSRALGIVGLEATGLDQREVHRMAMAYSVIEFATAVKPFFLRWLLQDRIDEVVYLDPDIQVFAPLDDISAMARDHGIVLTPHLERPLPRDRSLTPVEDIVLHAGIFNLGFIGVGQDATPFLDWWADRLARDCVVDTTNARFVDQRWVDLVTGYFQHHVLHDPTIDLAWWNLALRDLRHDGDGYTVEGEPLRFFHFSGYDPKYPYLLSKHAGTAPHVLLSERPAIQRICDEYADLLARAGHGELRQQSYGFAKVPNGLQIDDRMRRMYREALLAAERGEGPEPSNAFIPGEGDSFVEWLREETGPTGVPMRASRYLRRLHAERADLSAAFPDIDGADGPGFLDWCLTQGRIEEGIPSAILDGRPAAPAESLSRPLEPGVQLAGYLAAEAGVGEAARRVLGALRLTGEPYSVVAYDKTPSRQNHPVAIEGGSAGYDVNLICVNADEILRFNHDMGPAFRDGRYAIGMWWWEVDSFPDRFLGAFDVVDEVWVGSEFVRQAIAPRTDKPVHVVPIPVTSPRPAPGARRKLGVDDSFLFYFSFDLDSVIERKNPFALVEAFSRAFAPGEGPRLLIRSINGDRHLLELERLRHAASSHPDILIRDGYLDADLKDGLMWECDCYVSLHRSEGLGLTMAEAMAAGRPVIATAYSGNLEFMTDENSLLVPVETLRSVGSGSPPYPPDAQWAEPDTEAAAQLMRRAVNEREAMAALGRRAQQDVTERFSAQRTAAVIARHLARIRSDRRPVEVSTSATSSAAPEALSPSQPSASQRARRWLSGGPSVPWFADASVVNRTARRGLLRLLRPYLFRRAELDIALVEAHEETGGRIDAHEATLAETESSIKELYRHISELRGEIRSVDGRADTLARRTDARFDATTENLEARVAAVIDRIAQAEGAIGDVAAFEKETRASLTARPYLADPEILEMTDHAGRPAIGYHSDIFRDRGYLGFEDVFRGSEDFIASRLRPYLDVIGSRAPVLDVGCGRGEFLELLAEAGIAATGVDTDEGMVARCREKGHDATCIDAVAFLRECEPGSYGAIFSAQVIEHLPEPYLMEFLSLSLRALRPGGVFISETVNPHPIASFKAFWVDLTHESPIFPEVAVTLCGLTGFSEAQVVFPTGNGNLNDDLFREGQYAVIARLADTSSSDAA